MSCHASHDSNFLHLLYFLNTELAWSFKGLPDTALQWRLSLLCARATQLACHAESFANITTKTKRNNWMQVVMLMHEIVEKDDMKPRKQRRP
jgi:hypothetical protein